MEQRYVAPNYCSTGWSLYENIADMWAKWDKVFPEWAVVGGQPPETMTTEQAAAQKAVNEAYNKCYEHLDTCPVCSIEESRLEKKRATPVH
jgi:hypothetical protein